MKKLLPLVAALLLGGVFFTPPTVGAQITVPNTLVAGQTILAASLNGNFTALSDALNRTGGTMTGQLNSQAILPTADNTYSLGDGTHRFANLQAVGTVTLGTVTGTSFAGSGAGLTSIAAATALSGRITQANEYRRTYTSFSSGPQTLTTSHDEVACDATSGGFTLTLPTPVGNTGKTISIKKLDASANICTVATAAGLIDGAATTTIPTPLMSLTFVANGTNWEIR